MKRILLVFGLVGLSILLWFAFGWAQENCGDSLYVRVYPPDTLFSGFVRVPLYISHNRFPCMAPPYWICDSIHVFDILLSYTHTNPSKYCSLSHYWNNTWLYPNPDFLLQRSMFRHFISPEDDTLIHNWMMDLSQLQMGLEWDWRALALYDSGGFELSLLSLGCNPEDQLFGPANNVLLATMTFRVEDTMTICLDRHPGGLWAAASCTLQPEGSQTEPRDTVWFGFATELPYCFSLSYPARGDVNVDGIVNVGDMVFLINYLFMHGPPPVPLEIGDANCDGVVDIADVVYLVNYLFMGGGPPEC